MAYSILVVDDERDIKRLFEIQFRKEIEASVYELHFAYDGEEAFDLLHQIEVDIVFLDIRMPKMDGNELLRRLTPLFPHLKVIMVTAYTDMNNIRYALNHGAYDFITKPLDFEDVRTTLTRTCRVVDQLRETILYRDELISARQILDSILPNKGLRTDQVELNGSSFPARKVGGDFFNYYNMNNGYVSMFIADVCGKGFPAALTMFFIHCQLKMLAEESVSPSEMLESLNRIFWKSGMGDRFITVACAVQIGDSVVISTAGHCPLLLCKNGEEEISEIKSRGKPIGIDRDAEYESVSIPFRKGDVLVFYTDGVIEAVDREQNMYGMKRFRKAILDGREYPVEDMIGRILRDIRSFTSPAVQNDDITLLIMKGIG